MIKENSTIDISVYGPDSHVLSITLPWDANMEDWVNTFKTILIHQTFTLEAIKDVFFDEYTDIRVQEENSASVEWSGDSVGSFSQTIADNYSENMTRSTRDKQESNMSNAY